MRRWRLGLAYALALAVPALAALLRLTLPDDPAQRPLLVLFVPGLFAVAWLGGIGPGLLCTALTTALGVALLDHGWMPGAEHASRQFAWGLVLLATSGVLASLLAEAMQRGRRRDAQRAQADIAARDERAAGEARFRAMFEHLPDAIVFADTDGTIRQVNPAFERLFGYPAAEVAGQPLSRLRVPEGHPQDDADDVMTAVLGDDGDLRCRRSDGIEFWTRSSRTRVIGPDGQPLGIMETHRDVSAQRRHGWQARLWGQLFDQAHFGLAISSVATGRFLAVNPAFARQRGYRPEEMSGLPISTIFPADQLSRVQQGIEALDRNGHGVFEDEQLRKDGSRFHALSDITVVNDPQARPTFRLTYSLDVSERHEVARRHAQEQAQALEARDQARLAALNLMEDAVVARRRAEASAAALQESEAKYRMLAENGSDWIFWLGTDGRYHYVSPACLAVSGHPAEDFIADAGLMARLIHPLDRPAFERHAADLLHDDDTELELRLVHPDGSTRWIVHHCKPVFDDQGTWLGRRGVNIDITARKRAEQQLRQVSQAVEQSPDCIVITDTSGTIEYVNEAFVEQTGFSRQEVLGSNPRMLQSGRTPREVYDSLWQALTQGQAWKGEFLNRRKDGSEYTEFAIIGPLRDADGQVTHYVAVKEDVTDKQRMGAELDAYRHHLEELVVERTAELQQARAAAEAANQAKTAFLANMSHEIRTPMNAIIGLTHLVRRDATTPTQAERLAKVDAAARHLLGVINDVLDISKIEAGHMSLEAHDFALDAVLDHVAQLIDEPARSKGLQVCVQRDHVPCWLRGDETRLRQALLNYAGNAVKFTARGSITLSSHIEEVRGDQLLLRLEVRDTGMGIEPDALGRLFRSFEQADNSITRRFGGSGLGLVITRRIAQLMGGAAGADSTPGQGSTFWFTAWVNRGTVGSPAAPPAGMSEAELRHRHRGAKVLLAEDNPINREVAIELLAGAGLQVEVAENGRQAIERVLEGGHALVLMDMQMPEMDGLEATRAIRALPPERQLPILGMTANAFDVDRAACLAAGMDDFVSKPVDPPVLFALLNKWLPVRAGADIGLAPPGPASAPPAPTGAEIVERLRADPGIDVRQGLSVLRGRADRYVALLRELVRGHLGDMPRLGAALEAGDGEAARAITHSLKGVAGTLGVTTVAELARAMDQALRSQNWHRQALQPSMDAVVRELTRLGQVVALEAPEARP